MNKFWLPLILCTYAIAQTPTVTIPNNVGSVSLPTFIMFGGTYNQLQPGVNFWASGVVPVMNSIGLFESATIDLFPVRVTVNNKPVYIFTTSVREGVHKCSDANQPNVFCIGADGGYSFAQITTATASSGISAAVTLSYIRHVSKHWSIAGPIFRMLYMPTLGGWNPVVEVGVAYKP